MDSITKKRPYKDLLEQENRPYGVRGTKIKDHYTTFDKIDLCRYRDGYDAQMRRMIIYKSRMMALAKRPPHDNPFYPAKILTRKCKHGCSFCPHAYAIAGPDGKPLRPADITVPNLLRLAPAGVWTRREIEHNWHSQSMIRARNNLRELILREKDYRAWRDFSAEAVDFTDKAIELLQNYLDDIRDGGDLLDLYPKEYFCHGDLRDAEVLGPYNATWGMRFDILLSMIRVAYRTNRSHLFHYYHSILGKPSPKWSGKIFLFTGGRTTLDVPRWRWGYVFFVKAHGNLTAKWHKELRRDGIVYGEYRMPKDGPNSRLLRDPDMINLRKGLLAARDIHREIDLIANATQMMLTTARQRLWDSRKFKKFLQE